MLVGWGGSQIPTPVPSVKPIVVETIKIKLIQPRYAVYEITAYTAGFESTGKLPSHPYYGITASGAQVQERYTVACPPEIPFGTSIYIKELKWVYRCEDRGSAITANHLDIYIADLKQALKFGRQKMHIFILP